MWRFLLSLQLIWAIFVLLYQRKFFDRLSFLEKVEIQNNPTFDAFTRTDYPNWNRPLMIAFTIFFVPWRFALILLDIIFFGLLIKFFAFIFKVKDVSNDHNPTFRKIVGTTSWWAPNILLFFLCLFRTKRRIRLSPSKYPKLSFIDEEQAKRESKTPIPISISNHVTWIDIIYFMSAHAPGFMSKASIAKVPLVGLYARFLQSIFVERESGSDREKAIEMIEERIEKVKAGEKINTLHVFAEGTTTNGKSILKFKKGAFIGGVPVKLFALKYRSNFDVSMNMIGDLDNILGIFCQPYATLEITEVEGLIGNKDNLPPEEFAEEVRKVYIEEFGFKPSNCTFRDKKTFQTSFGI